MEKTTLDRTEEQGLNPEERMYALLEKFNKEEPLRKQEFNQLHSDITKKQMLENRNEVYFSNEFQKISFGEFSAKEQDVFFFIIAQIRNKECGIINLTYKEIKKAVFPYTVKDSYIAELLNKMKRISERFLWWDEKKRNPKYLGGFFDIFDIDHENKSLKIQIYDKWNKLFNDLEKKQYTKLNFNDFLKLKSSSSKALYALLMQWQYEGHTQYYPFAFLKFKLGAFSYSNKDFYYHVLLPAIEECGNNIANLEMEKLDNGCIMFRFKANKKTVHHYVRDKKNPAKGHLVEGERPKTNKEKSMMKEIYDEMEYFY